RKLLALSASAQVPVPTRLFHVPPNTPLAEAMAYPSMVMGLPTTFKRLAEPEKRLTCRSNLFVYCKVAVVPLFTNVKSVPRGKGGASEVSSVKLPESPAP